LTAAIVGALIRHRVPRRERDQRAQQEAAQARRDQEAALRAALAKAVWEKLKGPLKREDWVAIARQLLQDYEVNEGVVALLGHQPQPGNLKDAELQRLLIVMPVVEGIHPGTAPTALHALAKRFKVDAAKVKREFEAAERAKEKGEAAAPAKPRAAKPPKKRSAKQ